MRIGPLRKCVETIWSSEKCLFLLNLLLLLYTVLCYAVYQRLSADGDEKVAGCRRFGGPLAERTPAASHGFDTNEAYALEAFDFTEQRKKGLGQPANLNLGPMDPAVKWCFWPLHQVPLKPTSEQILGIPSQVPWQATIKPQLNLEWYLFASYLDTRSSHLCPDCQAQIQVLIMAKRSIDHSVYCQIYTEESQVPLIIVQGVRRMIWQREWDPRDRFYVPFLISCLLPPDTLKPNHHIVEVALTNTKCERASNLLLVRHTEVLHNGPPVMTDKPVVCVKGVDYLEDNSGRLLEWIEANLLMGADKIVMYTYAVHENARKVLEKYKADGSLVEVPLTLPGQQPNAPYQRSQFIWRNRQQKRRNEIVPYNDCLYRHLYTHRYVLIVDTDELVVPLAHDSWREMLAAASGDSDTWTAFSIVNAFKFDNASQQDDAVDTTLGALPPSLTHMLRHRRRSRALSQPGEYGKAFMYAPNLATVFNHFPLHKLRPDLRRTAHVKPAVALKLHFKARCPVESGSQCEELLTDTVPDDTLDRFGSQLKERIEKSARSIGFL